MLEALQHPRDGITLYEIAFRRAGVGFMWHEVERVKCRQCREDAHHWRERPRCERWKEGLVVYKYYPTFSKAVREEYKRLFRPTKANLRLVKM
jgi:hypothetical protein